MSDIDWTLVLGYLRPGAQWSLSGNDPATLVWHDDDTPPTVVELTAAAPAAMYANAYAEVEAARHAAYSAPGGPDSIFLRWQRGDATEQEWLDSVQAVKDANPYPDA